jgi:hypothetical protein
LAELNKQMRGSEDAKRGGGQGRGLKDISSTMLEKIKNIYPHVFRKMPVPILNIIGSLLYRHVGQNNDKDF